MATYRKIGLACMFIAMGASVSSYAAQTIFTGDDLKKRCSQGDLLSLQICDGLVSTVGGGLLNAQAKAKTAHKTPVTCIPDEIGSQELTRTVTWFMSEHPELLRFDAQVVAALAISNAYQCPKP